MFGKNKIASANYDADGSLVVVGNPWFTLQGEGPDAGRPAIFLRLTGCNLRCFWCDTEFESGGMWTLSNLVSAILHLSRQHKCRLLVLTGGEPLLQNIVPLVRVVNAYSVEVAVETAGSVAAPDMVPWFGPSQTFNKIVCSPKTGQVNKQVQVCVHSYKYIIDAEDGVDPEDGLPIKSTQKPGASLRLFRPPSSHLSIFVQPCDRKDPARNATNHHLAARVAMQHGYRLSVQVHKYVDVD